MREGFSCAAAYQLRRAPAGEACGLLAWAPTSPGPLPRGWSVQERLSREPAPAFTDVSLSVEVPFTGKPPLGSSGAGKDADRLVMRSLPARTENAQEDTGSRPILSLTAFRRRCLQPKYRSEV